MAETRKKTEGGHYYAHDPRTGALRDAPPGVPDVVICRRLRDVDGRLPKTAAVTDCTRCGCAIVFNPDGPHQDRPKVCMQCADIEPLPMGPTES